MTRAAQRFRQLTRPATTPLAQVQHFARLDVTVFAEHVVEDEKTFAPIILAAHHRAILDHVRYCWERSLHSVNLSPWATGKTSLLQGVLLFALGGDPTLRCKLACASRNAANERVSTVGRIIVNNPRYRAVFPLIAPGDQWSDGVLVLVRPPAIRDASLEGYGATSATVGGRTDLLALDDLNDEQTARSTRRREATGAGFYSKFISRLDGASRLVMICTKHHEQDIHGVLLREETQRAHIGFLWIRAIIAGDLRGRCLLFETVLPGDHGFLRHAFKHGLGWAPIKRDILATIRRSLPATDEATDAGAA
jgi:hypothetical protein